MSGALFHGGDLAGARVRWPDAPQPWVDLSTGINPVPWPIPPLSPESFTRLPGRDALERLKAAAAARYGAPSAACVVAGAGSQALLPLLAAQVAPGTARILAPTYAEHARAAALAGHHVEEVARPEDLAGAALAVVVNPNNPDGRLLPRALLLDVTRTVGMLVVDQAFGDVAPPGFGVDDAVADVPGLVVLRSFGKFYGLAGVRLGFALLAPERANALAERLGPWAVSGPALEIGAAALEDRAWATTTRARLDTDAARLDALLAPLGRVVGGTSLFRLLDTPRAPALHEALGQAGILVRPFPEHPHHLRFGLPGSPAEWERLETALATFP